MELSVTQSHSLHTGAPDITNAPIVAHLEAAHTIVAGSAIITRQKIILKMEIWVACTVSQDHGDTWAAAADHGSVVLLQLRSVLMSTIRMNTGDPVVDQVCWSLGTCWANSTPLPLALGELILPLKGELWCLGKVGPISHHGHGRAGYVPCPKRVFPAAQNDQLSFYPGTHPDLWAVTPQHLPHLWHGGDHEETGPAVP